MARHYTRITFTDDVRNEQARLGVRAAAARMEAAAVRDDRLSETEREFIEARDGFYMGSVNSDGWPYVQFRGGPPGFVRVLDDRTLGYADFRGNLQYISVGNLRGDDRVSLFFMDYANRRRLKVAARAEVLDRSERPELIDRLEVPTYRARVERAVLLHVVAFDWNCPQHITPRLTRPEWSAMATGSDSPDE